MNPTKHCMMGLAVVLSMAMVPIKVASYPLLSYGDNDEVNVDHSLSIEERQQSHQVKLLHIENGADSDVLDDPKLFRNVVLVTLQAPSNEHFIEALALNHGRIRALCISQSCPLSASTLSSLAKFKNLTELELHCKLSDPKQIGHFIPLSLNSLTISEPYDLPSLPTLTRLTIKHCSVDREFFERLDAPKLQSLNLMDSTIEEGALKSLEKYPHLHQVCLPKDCEGQRDAIGRLTHAHIYITGDPLGPPTKLVAPLRPVPSDY